MTEPHDCRTHRPLNRPAPQGTTHQCPTCGAWWQYTTPAPARHGNILLALFRPPPTPAPQWQRLRWWSR